MTKKLNNSLALTVGKLASERIYMESSSLGETPIFCLIEQLISVNIGLGIFNYF
jgi:hypothetical protein